MPGEESQRCLSPLLANMKRLFFGIFLLQACSQAQGFANGAPTSTCSDMKPEHKGVHAQSGAAPYTILTSNSTFQTGQPITVIINGSDYSGFLLLARSGSSSTALGSWDSPPSNTQNLQCSGNSKGAMTHSNINTKNKMTVYTWMPPPSSNSIFFIATVATNRETYWLDVKSETLIRLGTSSAPDPNMASMTVFLCVTFLVSTVFLS